LVFHDRRYPSFDTRPETRKNARMPRSPDHQHAERIIEVARQWARAQKNILAVALVGSCARKTARPASDMDLVMLTYEPTSFRTDTTWCHAIDWAAVNARQLKCKDEDYGLLWSRRLLLDYNGGEIEWGFVSLHGLTFTRLIPERDGSSQTSAYTTREDC
jgi:Nucleotidyltransferase domain